MLETDGELSSPDCSIYSLLTAEYVEPGTLSGGERGITAEFHLVSQAVCTDSIRISCVTDCYSNSRELEVERSECEMGCVQRRRPYAVSSAGRVRRAARAARSNAPCS